MTGTITIDYHIWLVLALTLTVELALLSWLLWVEHILIILLKY